MTVPKKKKAAKKPAAKKAPRRKRAKRCPRMIVYAEPRWPGGSGNPIEDEPETVHDMMRARLDGKG